MSGSRRCCLPVCRLLFWLHSFPPSIACVLTHTRGSPVRGEGRGGCTEKGEKSGLAAPGVPSLRCPRGPRWAPRGGAREPLCTVAARGSAEPALCLAALCWGLPLCPAPPPSSLQKGSRHLLPGTLLWAGVRPAGPRNTLGGSGGAVPGSGSREGPEAGRHRPRAWPLWASRGSVGPARHPEGGPRSGGAGPGWSRPWDQWPWSGFGSDAEEGSWGGVRVHMQPFSLQQAGAIKTSVTGTSMPAGKGRPGQRDSLVARAPAPPSLSLQAP